ncbi:2Fe-2S iron-sulfur cluster-binding protein, partial [Burkholderia sp. SIMBA_024]
NIPSVVTADLSDDSVIINDTEIRERMSGNLCRCGAYNGIVEAISETLVQPTATQTDERARA